MRNLSGGRKKTRKGKVDKGPKQPASAGLETAIGKIPWDFLGESPSGFISIY
jgi:hypothetical protein